MEEISSSISEVLTIPPSSYVLSSTMQLRPRKKLKQTPHLPEDVVLYNILTWVPLKCLYRLKCVSKTFNRVISNSHLFAAIQSYHSGFTCPATVSLDKHGLLVFLPTLTRSPVGIPDPSLGFIGDGIIVRIVLASTNGLLCLRCSCDCGGFLYVCNPVTKEGTRVPISSIFCKESVGLAFDPSRSPDYYMLVHPIRSNARKTNGVEYEFEVFSSRSREWIKSNQTVIVENFLWKESRPVFANGVLYWYCTAYLLWFDCENELSGYILLPQELPRFAEQELGVCGDQVTCTRLSGESLDLWMLVGSCRSCRWEKRYQMSIESMVQSNTDIFSTFWETMSLRSRKKVSEGLVEKYQLCPLPFEGGDKVFFTVMPRNKSVVKEKVLSYDMKSGEVAEVFKGKLFEHDKFAFGYSNSLVPLPK